MSLNKNAIEWALSHLSKFGDSDLFPKPIELEALVDQKDDVMTLVAARDLSQFEPNPARTFMVPKDDLSFRRATQLNIFDSMLLTAIMYQYGEGIEHRRHSIDQNIVFSYRYDPQSEYWLYDRSCNWTSFWQQCSETSWDYSHALVLDISDFYNQISHAVIEDQLTESKFPAPVVQWVKNLVQSLTSGVLRGIPVGPHAAHLLAEASLIPLDNSLMNHGIEYIRFVDDMIVFGNGEKDCRKRLYQITDILDKQQRLILNKSKTAILEQSEIQELCSERIKDRPINESEKKLLDIIKQYSNNNPYQTISLSEMEEEDRAQFKPEIIASILQEYLDATPIEFTRLRWFLRRLTQIGHPGAVRYCLTYLESLTPALADVCHYLLAASQNQNEEIPAIGKDLILALDNDLIKTNQYFQICLLSLFGRNAAYNHFPNLVERYASGSSDVKREIILAAYCANKTDWLRELQESFSSLGPWAASAFLIAAKLLPEKERKSFISNLPKESEFVELIKKWIDSPRTSESRATPIRSIEANTQLTNTVTSLPGLSPDLGDRLRRALTESPYFEKDATLRNLFTDKRIVAWRDVIPDNTDFRKARVNALIDALYNETDANGENALILFLHVLAEHIDPGNADHARIRELIDELEYAR